MDLTKSLPKMSLQSLYLEGVSEAGGTLWAWQGKKMEKFTIQHSYFYLSQLMSLWYPDPKCTWCPASGFTFSREKIFSLLFIYFFWVRYDPASVTPNIWSHDFSIEFKCLLNSQNICVLKPCLMHFYIPSTYLVDYTAIEIHVFK